MKSTTQTQNQHLTLKLSSVGTWLVALTILAVTLYWLGLEDILGVLSQVSAPILAASVIAFLIAIFLRLFKWKLVVGADYNWGETTRIFLASKVMGGLLPARIGEFAPLATSRFRTAKVSALIIIDRVFESYVSLFAGAVGFAILGFHNQTLVVLWIAIFLTISTASFLLFYRPLWRRLAATSWRWQWLSQGFALAEKVSQSLQTIGGYWVPLLLFSVAATILDFIFIQLVFLSLGQMVQLPLIATAWCASVLTSVVAFTPAGLGIADLPPLYLYHLYDVPSGPLGAQFVLARMIAMLLPILLLFIAFGLRRREARWTFSESER